MELSADVEEVEGGEAEHISRHIRIQYSRVQGRKDVVPEEQQSGWVKILITQTIHILLLYEYIYIYIHGTAPTTHSSSHPCHTFFVLCSGGPSTVRLSV